MTLARDARGDGARRVAWARIGLLVVGAAAVAGLVWQVGPGRILAELGPLRWSLVLAPVPYAAVLVFDALGWRWAFEEPPPVSQITITLAHASGKALDVVTPFVPIGGDPVRAALLRSRGVPLAAGGASLVIGRTASVLAQGAFVAVGLAVAAAWLTPALVRTVILALTVGGIAVAAFILVQSARPFSRGLGLLRRPLGRLGLRLPLDGARDLDERIARYYRRRKGRLAVCVGAYLMGWLALGVEAYVLLALLGWPPPAAAALGIAALCSVIRSASFMIPASLGAQEGGDVLVLGAFGLPAELALAFSLMRRARELLWTIVGLAVLAGLQGLTRRRAEDRR